MRSLPALVLRALPVLAAVAWMVGVAWRYWHLLVVHPMDSFVYSDMQSYRDAALHFADPTYVPGIADSLFPPGAGTFYGLLYRADPTWQLAKWTMLLLSSAVPLLVGGIARLLFDRAVAASCIVVASLYFHFIDYFAFFLSEGPFVVCLLVAVLSLCTAMKARGRRAGVVVAAASGVFFALAASIRSVALAWALLFGALMVVWAFRDRRRELGPLVAALSIGLAVVLVPLARRCTRLNEGRTCVVSTNAEMNMLLGHLPFGRAVHWEDRARGYRHSFGSPAAAQRALYKRELTVPFGPYDPENREKALELAKREPLETLGVSFDQMFNLFGGTVPWPTAYTAWYRSAVATEQFFVVFVLLPALGCVGRRARDVLRLAPRGAPEILMCVPLVGMMAVSFLTLGEPRYRIPLDGFVMVLAASEWVRALRGTEGRRILL